MVRMLLRQDGSYKVTVNKALVESLGLKSGDEMAFFIVGGEIVANPGDLILRRIATKDKPELQEPIKEKKNGEDNLTHEEYLEK